MRNTTGWRTISLATVLLVGTLSVAGAAQQPPSGQYRLTAKLIDALGHNLARRPTDSMEDAWKDIEALQVRGLRGPFVLAMTDGERHWLAEHLVSHLDAWDRPLRISLNAATHTALIASAGPDGIENTPDDLICRFESRVQQDDDGQNREHYARAWTVPQALTMLGYQYLGDDGGTVNGQSVPPQSVTMQDLTVPKDRLPDGCSLKVIEPGRQEVIATSATGQTIRVTGHTPSMQPAGITANPWTGTDRHALADLRQSVDGNGMVRLPDALPLTTSETSAMLLQFADGVEEGYAATYAQAGGRDLGVWAVKFDRPPEMYLEFPGDGRRSQPVVVVTMGSIRAALFGDGGACSTAIETYLKSLGK